MKNKWFISGCLILLTIAVFGSAVSGQEEITLTISEMISRAINHNLSFQKAVLQLENTDLDIQGLEAENLLTQSQILNQQKEINILQQKATFQSQKDQLILETVDNYFRLLLAEKDIIRKEKNVELERVILKEVEAQVAAGYSVDLDLLQQGNVYYDSLFSFEKAKLDYEQLLIEVKNKLGIDSEAKILIKPAATPQFVEIEQDVALAKVRENSLNLKSKIKEIELAERKLEKAQIDGESFLNISKQENNLKIVKMEKILLEQDLDFQTATQWQNLKQSKNNCILNEQSLEQMKENESNIKKQVQAGLRTSDELLSAALGVLDAEYRLITSVRQCYQSYLDLQKMMGMLEEGEIK